MKVEYDVVKLARSQLLVVTSPMEPALRAQAADWLRRREVDITSVSFLEWENDEPRLFTADGTFSLEAVMAACACLARMEDVPLGADWQFALPVSGLGDPLPCAVTPVRTACLVTLSLPLPEQMGEKSFPLTDGTISLPVVSLPGLSCLIAPAGAVARTSAAEALRFWSTLLPGSAAALLLWNEGAGILDALICDKASGQCRWVDSCAAGVGAMGAWLTTQRRKNQCLTLKQNGGPMAVTTRWQEKLEGLSVSGSVEWLRRRSVNLVF